MHTRLFNLLALMVGSIGIVYGDIGTSPLYTLEVCFTYGKIPLTNNNILGVISLIFWSLTNIVGIKYIFLLMRADNKGEGGVMALIALIGRSNNKTVITLSSLIGVIAASLFYGDGVLTPAISVMGALEGLEVISPKFKYLVVPLSIALLSGLFFMQRFGTYVIGKFFGPVMVLWFLSIGYLGMVELLQHPKILNSINPYYIFLFFETNGFKSIMVLATVVLAITGAEALYADMGHFGRAPIQRSWFVLVYPALILNYLGQGALLLESPKNLANPFYMLVPEYGMYPMIVLATFATIIASQSIISGVFSMTWQATQLNYLPNMKIIHTSSDAKGQVYIPFINKVLFVLTVICILQFQNTKNLSQAYGITVTAIFVLTTIMAMILASINWKWSKLKIALVFAPLLIIDLSFFSTNCMKFLEGGWFPVAIAGIAYLISSTWKKGSIAVFKINQHRRLSIGGIAKSISRDTARIPGCAIYLGRESSFAPKSFKLNLKHYKYMHEVIVFTSIIITNAPRVNPDNRIKITNLGKSLYQVNACYGFVEVPNLSIILEMMIEKGVPIDRSDVTFFLSKDIPVFSMRKFLSAWRENLYMFLVRNASNPTNIFHFPKGKTIEIRNY